MTAQTTILAFYRSLFHVWSNTHRQYLSGTTNPLLFDAVVSEISTYAAPVDSIDNSRINQPRVLVKWAWESERFIYNPAFRVFVDSIMDSSKR